MKSELLRYAHFYERFVAHQRAEQFAATEQLQKVKDLEDFLRTFGFSVSDLRFLTEAVQQIRSSRRFLKWTYAAGFFAKYRPEELRLFEFPRHSSRARWSASAISWRTP